MNLARPGRRQALQDLVELRVSLRVALEALAHHPWDSEVEYLTVTRHHTLEALNAYATSLITPEELVAWAEALSGREDLGFADGKRGLVAESIFQLSSPELFGPVDDLARDLQGRLA